MARSVVIGLDIGTTHVRAAEVESGGSAGPRLVRYAAVPLPLGAVRDGEVAEPATVASSLRRLWQEGRFSSRDVAIGIGNQRVLVRELELPAMPMAQIRASLPFQVQEMLPVAVDDALLDYYPVDQFAGQNGPAVRGLLVAATKDTVSSNVVAVEAAGLRPIAVDLNAFALVRSLAASAAVSRTTAIVDIGARVSTVVIVDDGRPQLVRILPSGGQDVTDAVAAAIDVSWPEAERIKRETGVGLQVHESLAAAAQTVNAVTRTLVDSIRNTFVYYASNHPGRAAESVVLSGGMARMPGLGQFLSSASRLPVSLGQPLGAMRMARTVPGGDVLANEQIECSVAVGLGLAVAA